MSHAPQSSGAVIESDIRCITCGYNLRGLTRSSLCPECGGLVLRSLHVAAQLERGKLGRRRAQLVLAEFLNAGLLLTGFLIGGGAFGLVMLDRWFGPEDLVALLILALGFGLLRLGAWWATLPGDPRRWRTHRLVRWRDGARHRSRLFFSSGLALVIAGILLGLLLSRLRP